MRISGKNRNRRMARAVGGAENESRRWFPVQNRSAIGCRRRGFLGFSSLPGPVDPVFVAKLQQGFGKAVRIPRR
jgi:hypothetical protein